MTIAAKYAVSGCKALRAPTPTPPIYSHSGSHIVGLTFLKTSSVFVSTIMLYSTWAPSPSPMTFSFLACRENYTCTLNILSILASCDTVGSITSETNTIVAELRP